MPTVSEAAKHDGLYADRTCAPHEAVTSVGVTGSTFAQPPAAELPDANYKLLVASPR